MSLTSFFQRAPRRPVERRSGVVDRDARSRAVGQACLEALEERRLLSFSPAVNYPTPLATPSAMVTADFNNDGNLDLATSANALTGSVSVHLGDGAGGFGAAQRTVLASYLGAIAAADFNNDGRVDLAVSDTIGFYVLAGNGDGTFQPATARHAWGAGMVDVGDFNGDGNDDVLVSWIDGDWATHFQVYRGNGQGGFTPGLDAYYWGWGTAAAVDLNNDGWLEVVTSDAFVFFVDGIGSLTFDWGQRPPPVVGGAIASGDFTGDGYADVIVAGDGVAVVPGNGDGTFDAPFHHAVGGGYDDAVATGDFNGDGRLDAVVTDAGLGTASVMLGNGDGTLRFFGAFAAGAYASDVVTGDFDGDGRTDAAVSKTGIDRGISVLLNDGDWGAPPPPPPPSMRVSDASVTEGNAGTRSATFTVTLSAPPTQPVTVRYATSNGTATAGTDYQGSAGTLTFAPGQTTATIAVPVIGDRRAEPNETFSVRLIDPTNATIADDVGLGTILDDEPRLSINNASATEGKGGKKAMTFTVTLSAAYDQAVTVNFATRDGTATAGEDYVARSGTLTFAPGETVKTISITVMGDKKREADETFYVDLFGVSGGNALPAGSPGTGTILDGDHR